jgi:endonuclease YncB( thermonuclease family)
VTGWRHFTRAEVARAVDGDTLEVVIDLGFEVSTRIRVRLAYIDAPEVVGESRAWGVAARMKLETFRGMRCEVWTRRPSFGRYEGFVLAEETGDLGRWAITNGLARAWDHEHEQRAPWLVFPIEAADSRIEEYKYETHIAERLKGEPTLFAALKPEEYLA